MFAINYPMILIIKKIMDLKIKIRICNLIQIFNIY